MNFLFEDEIEDYRNIKNCNLKDGIYNNIINYLKGKNIIIYGAGSLGEMMYERLTLLNITITAFIDRRFSEDFKSVYGVEVVSPNEIHRFNSEKYLIIMSISKKVVLNADDNILQFINHMSPKAFIINKSNSFLFILMENNCIKKRKLNEDLCLTDCQICGGYDSECAPYMDYLYDISIKPLIKDNSYKSTKFDWFGYIIGQRCNLNCELCCEQISNVNNGIFVKKEVIYNDCLKIASSCKFLKFIELVGGEPFLHPNFLEIVESLLTIENIGYIRIFTNGTISFNDKHLEIIKNPRVSLIISNYTNQVSKINTAVIYKNMNILKQNNIRYMFVKSDVWMDFNAIKKRNQSKKELSQRFLNCYLRNCHRVFNGVLYQCPRNYCMHEINEIDSNENDDTVRIHNFTVSELAYVLDDFELKEFSPICDYCLLPFDGKCYPAGLQKRRDKYSIINL